MLLPTIIVLIPFISNVLNIVFVDAARRNPFYQWTKWLPKLGERADIAKVRQYFERAKEEFKQKKQLPAHHTSLSIDDFLVNKTIGTGGFSQVVKASRKDTGEVFALKRLDLLSGIVGIDDVENEVDIMQHLDFPFVVKFNGTFRARDMRTSDAYIVMEYAPNGNLGELWSKLYRSLLEYDRRPRPSFLKLHVGNFCENIVQFYAAQVALGLQYLHEMNILYRDLKLENVLLDKDYDIKLVDFGLSKKVATPFTHSYSMVGTRDYEAPEILWEGVGHTSTADWWSYGILVYFLLGGADSKEAHQAIFQPTKNQVITLPSTRSEAAKKFVSKLLQWKPENRYGSERFDFYGHIMTDPFFANMDWFKLLNKQVRSPLSEIMDLMWINKASKKDVRSQK